MSEESYTVRMSEESYTVRMSEESYTVKMSEESYTVRMSEESYTVKMSEESYTVQTRALRVQTMRVVTVREEVLPPETLQCHACAGSKPTATRETKSNKFTIGQTENYKPHTMTSMLI